MTAFTYMTLLIAGLMLFRRWCWPRYRVSGTTAGYVRVVMLFGVPAFVLHSGMIVAGLVSQTPGRGLLVSLSGGDWTAVQVLGALATVGVMASSLFAACCVYAAVEVVTALVLVLADRCWGVNSTGIPIFPVAVAPWRDPRPGVGRDGQWLASTSPQDAVPASPQDAVHERYPGDVSARDTASAAPMERR